MPFPNGSGYRLNGGSGNDTVFGGKGAGVLLGGAGDDRLSAMNGRSQIDGGTGNDTLFLTGTYSDDGVGRARIDGGGGFDSLSLQLSSGSRAFIADFSQHKAVLADDAVVIDCEAVQFSSGSGDDHLFASNSMRGVNELRGNSGDDMLRASGAAAILDGGWGDDLLRGAAGGDVLNGGQGRDRLTGGSGGDVIDGGAGTDFLSGGFGEDLFVFASPWEAGLTLRTADVVTDFRQSQNDRLDLSGFRFAVSGHGPLTFAGDAAFSMRAGEIRFTQNEERGRTVVQFDRDGDAGADGFIVLQGLISLTGDDLILA